MKKSPVLIVVATAAVLGVISFIVLSAASFLSGNKRSSALPVVGSDKVALVRLEGLLVSSEDVVDELNDYAEDSSIKAIVIRIDSPGGGVVVSQEIYNA